jgi:hypothetical protein
VYGGTLDGQRHSTATQKADVMGVLVSKGTQRVLKVLSVGAAMQADSLSNGTEQIFIASLRLFLYRGRTFAFISG